MGKTHRFEETRTVRGKTPEQCFEWLTNPANGTKWVSSANEVWAEGEPGVGRVIHAKAGMLGVSMDVEQVVTAWEPGERYAYEGSKPFDISFDFKLTGEGDDTRIDAILEVDPGKFFPVGGFIVARTIKKQAEGDFDRLASHLEDEA